MLGNSRKYITKKIVNHINSIQELSGSKRYYATEATFVIEPFPVHKLENGPPTKTLLTRDDALKYYLQLQTIRQIEASVADIFHEKLIRGIFHLYSGQEAIAVGVKAALRPHDAVITAYRTHGWAYLMGTHIIGIIAEIMGRNSGCARGKGGSMHMYSENFYGGHSIVGAQVPLGAGIALAFKYQGKNRICVTAYGDAAANQGQVFEAFNMAKLWNIPVVFICENNGYGMNTKAHLASANSCFYTKGDYIPGIQVDGMDVIAVREAAKYAVQHCNTGKGPIILEALTYRYFGRSFNDPNTYYRTRQEVEAVKQARDPVSCFAKKIISSNLVTAEELQKIKVEIKLVVDEATTNAKADKEIGVDELAADIYSVCNENKIRNVTPFNSLKHKHIDWIRT